MTEILNTIVMPYSLSANLRDADSDMLMIDCGTVKAVFDHHCRTDRLHIIHNDGLVTHYARIDEPFEYDGT